MTVTQFLVEDLRDVLRARRQADREALGAALEMAHTHWMNDGAARLVRWAEKAYSR